MDRYLNRPGEELDEAIEIAGRDGAKWRELGSQRVRIVRALVYEGPADWLRKQLGASLSPGVRELSPGRPDGPTITVSEGHVKLVEK